MIIMIMMNKQKLTCKKCKYSWIPRKKKEYIRECPNCKNRNWDDDKIKNN